MIRHGNFTYVTFRGAKKYNKKYLQKWFPNKIIFIPTAGNVEPYTGYIDEGVEMLKSLGYELKLLIFLNMMKII